MDSVSIKQGPKVLEVMTPTVYVKNLIPNTTKGISTN